MRRVARMRADAAHLRRIASRKDVRSFWTPHDSLRLSFAYDPITRITAIGNIRTNRASKPVDVGKVTMLENVSGMSIEEDSPNTRLSLAWRGAPTHAGWRWFATAVFLLAIAGIVTLGVSAGKQIGGNPQQQGEAAILGVMAAVGLLLLHYCGTILGSVLGYWRRLDWDAADGLFTARKAGWFIWGRESKSIPFAAVRMFSLEMGPDGHAPLSLQLSLTTRDLQSSKFNLTSLGLEQRSEGLELLHTVAHLIRAEGYRVDENTPRRQVVQVWKTRLDYAGIEEPENDDDDEADELETDFLTIPPRAERLPVSAPVRPPYSDSVRPKTQFDLQRLQDSLQITRIEDWQPGQLVRIIRRSAPLFVHILVTGLAMGIASALGYWFVFNVLQNFIGIENESRWIVLGFSAAIAGCCIGFLCWNNLQESELVFDWRQNCLTLRYGLNVRQWALTDIQQLVLSTKEHTQASDSTDSPSRVTGYGARLDVFLPLEDLIVIQTEQPGKTSTAAQEQLAPMGSLLARELGVQYSHGERGKTDADDPTKALRFGPFQIAALTLIAVAAITLIALVANRDYQIRQTVGSLKTLNVDATKMGSYGYNKSRVCEHYVSIRMGNNAVLKEHGDEIGALLRQLPRVAFDLSGSSLTDEDLAHLRGIKTVMADISKTKIADTGVTIFAESGELIFLQADESSVGDEAMAALENQTKLRFLFIRQTRVTPAGRKLVSNLPSMEVFR
jgi:hypothetical protein